MVARVPPSSSRDVSQNFPTPSLPHSSSPSPFSLHLSPFLPLHSHTTTPVLPHTSMLRPAPTTSATSALARADQAIKQRIRSGPFLLITQSGGMLILAIWHRGQSGPQRRAINLMECPIWPNLVTSPIWPIWRKRQSGNLAIESIWHVQ